MKRVEPDILSVHCGQHEVGRLEECNLPERYDRIAIGGGALPRTAAPHREPLADRRLASRRFPACAASYIVAIPIALLRDPDGHLRHLTTLQG